MQADKLLAKAKAARAEAGSDQGKKKGIEPRAPTSFAHEMNMNREAFAFGGLDPGTLHAHGKLVKVRRRCAADAPLMRRRCAADAPPMRRRCAADAPLMRR